MLDQLFGAAVQEADMGIDSSHYLAVKLQHQAQNPVRSRMLRSKVDREVAEILFVHGQAFGSAFSSPGSTG